MKTTITNGAGTEFRLTMGNTGRGDEELVRKRDCVFVCKIGFGGQDWPKRGEKEVDFKGLF